MAFINVLELVKILYMVKTTRQDLETKITEFSRAIEKYNKVGFYIKFELFLSVVVIALQIFGLLNVLQYYTYTGFIGFAVALFVAYIATDFFNGLVHMIVDNNTNYNSIVGPYIASFHMHHYKIKYKEIDFLKIYFYESGHKFWLVVYLIVLACSQGYFKIDANVNLGLVSFGVLSSVAELSHYWCHNPAKNNSLVCWLQKHRILLSLKHHRLHHVKDNINYAFLNGVSDPLLNIIARYYFKGYKQNSDIHVAAYANR